MSEQHPEFELFYWPQIPGRGEFVRLVLEAAGADYVDVGRRSEDAEGGPEAVRDVLGGGEQAPAYAPPVLRHGERVFSQTSNICLYLAKELSLVPKSVSAVHTANQLQLTLQDLLKEAHDTHHPISVAEYYEDQKEAAKRRAAFFVDERIPKYLEYFENVREASEGPHLLEVGFSYVDLSTFQVVRGLQYAFPNAMARQREATPGLFDLADRVEERPAISEHLDSDRRLPFNEHGIFRHYPELDVDESSPDATER